MSPILGLRELQVLPVDTFHELFLFLGKQSAVKLLLLRTCITPKSTMQLMNLRIYAFIWHPITTCVADPSVDRSG